MGYPSENIEGMYRNPLHEVQRLLETLHRDHYKLYNLCSERHYDYSKFHHRVSVFPFDDHNAPPVQLISDFLKDADCWLNQHNDNVVAIHCKAGKGRTGMMIACLLLHLGISSTAEAALQYFAEKRTIDGEVSVSSILAELTYCRV